MLGGAYSGRKGKKAEQQGEGVTEKVCVCVYVCSGSCMIDGWADDAMVGGGVGASIGVFH